MDRLNSAFIGSSGFVASLLTAQIDPAQLADIFQILAQIAIAVATLVGLLRPRKKQ